MAEARKILWDAEREVVWSLDYMIWNGAATGRLLESTQMGHHAFGNPGRNVAAF